MTEYHLLTIWRIAAPLEEVYATIVDSLRWPEWWPAARQVEQTAGGDSAGLDSVRRYSWQGKLPYRLVFEVRTTRLDNLVAIEGIARGDLEGVGRWHFSRQGGLTVVRYEWQVRSTRWWMNLICPLARPMFIRNHRWVMEQGGEGLACRLGLPLVSQETKDLLAAERTPRALPWRWRESGRIDPAMVLVAGLVAGTLATLAQLVLWWLAGLPLPDTLFRDARLTAALVMGSHVLPPPSTAQWDILLVATLIHFALSIVYAVIPAGLAKYLSTAPALAAGAVYGLAIYWLNMYGLTAWFPWFSLVRDWLTLFTHLVFGMTLVGACRLYVVCAVRWPRKSPAGGC